MVQINKNKELESEQYILDHYDYNPNTGHITNKKSGRKVGNVDKTGYEKIRMAKIQILSHRIAWFLYYGYWPGILDHIDRNKANNRIWNLRECTQQENQRNVVKRKNNTSGYKNVSKNRNGWQICFTINSKSIKYGTYATPEKANELARKIEKLIFQDFAPENPNDDI